MRKILAFLLTISMVFGSLGLSADVRADESEEPVNQEESMTEPETTEGDASGDETEASRIFTDGELIFHGVGYDVTLTYDAAAEIPEGAELQVREIEKGTPEYDSYLQVAEAAVDKDVQEARFFDITIVKDGAEIQPKSPVRVNISCHDAIEVADEGEVQALHFEEGMNEPDKLDTDTNEGSEVSEVSFDADSFSVFGIVYTVDFTYDGYTYSIPGGARAFS